MGQWATVALFGLLGACNSPRGGSDAPATAGAATGAKQPAASASATATAAATAAPAPLGERFVGPPPEGTERSGQRLGVPAGWQKGEFGEVRTESKDGYASLYDLPQYPASLPQVELRATSMGCRPVKLEEPVDGVVGSKRVPAKIYQGTGKREGVDVVVWAVAINIDKTDNPKVIVVAVQEAARSRLEKDVPAIVQGYADSF